MIAFASVQSAQAVVVVPPTDDVAGVSQQDLGDLWWQWAFGICAASNPISDPDGGFAQVDNGGPVFFVAGTFGGAARRTFDVPAGRPIFFPLVNIADWELPQYSPNCLDSGDPDPYGCALGFLTGLMDDPDALGMQATLDGVDLLPSGAASFRQTSGALFSFTLPADNLLSSPQVPVDAGLYDPTPGTGDFLGGAVSDGYWMALAGLSPGRHTLVFGGGIPVWGDPVLVTATLNVVPEPGTLVLFGLGLAGLFSTQRRIRAS